MKFSIGLIIFALIIVLTLFLFFNKDREQDLVNNKYMNSEEIILPHPEKVSQVSIEEALLRRRSIRDYKDEPLVLKEVSQVLWAAQGITDSSGRGRTAPSAGGLYSLEVYLVVRDVEDLKPGAYHYFPQEHKLKRILEGDINKELAEAGLNQSWIEKAPINLIITAFYSRTTAKYGERGVRYVHLEAGHAAQNVYLQAESLGLGTVVVGAFYDDEIKKLLGLSEEEVPIYIMPIGKK